MDLDFNFTPYRWRGKTYKTVTGVLRAANNAYPGVGGNFAKDYMSLRYRDGRELRFARELRNGVWCITAEPQEVPA